MFYLVNRNGKVVGYLRRGGFGYTINKSLGIGYVDLKDKHEGQSIRDFVLNGQYQIDIMGTKHNANVSLEAVFDPKKTKMMTGPLSK